MKCKILLLITLIIVVFLPVGCSSSDDDNQDNFEKYIQDSRQKLIGTWVEDSVSYVTYTGGRTWRKTEESIIDTLEFKSDGTGVNRKHGWVYSFKWTFYNMIVSYSSTSYFSIMSISDYRMRISTSNSFEYIYKKIK